MCVMKNFAIFLLSKKTFTIRKYAILASFFCKLLSKATLERKLSNVYYFRQRDADMRPAYEWYASVFLRQGLVRAY